jgi:membrane protease YdiL (CAAX protease family)
VIPLLPAVLVFAAANAFGENFAFRAALLPSLLPPVGKRQALLLTAILFALPHIGGIPAGLIGVPMTLFMGWLLGKSMVETRGFFWAWVMQWPADIVVYLFFALAAVSGGG